MFTTVLQELSVMLLPMGKACARRIRRSVVIIVLGRFFVD
jgi:hypothetical protein